MAVSRAARTSGAGRDERAAALHRDPLGELERPTGFEPATSSLGSWHSATELRPLVPPILVFAPALSNPAGIYLSDMS